MQHCGEIGHRGPLTSTPNAPNCFKRHFDWDLTKTPNFSPVESKRLREGTVESATNNAENLQLFADYIGSSRTQGPVSGRGRCERLPFAPVNPYVHAQVAFGTYYAGNDILQSVHPFSGNRERGQDSTDPDSGNYSDLDETEDDSKDPVDDQEGGGITADESEGGASATSSLDEVFCTVPGRTSLLSSQPKYKVSVAELQRRISFPECLNASLIGGILRRAKTKEGANALRTQLMKHGVSLPPGRRRSANITAFTSLVEEEALHFAQDFGQLSRDCFPAQQIAELLTRRTPPEQSLHRMSVIQNTINVLQGMYEMLISDRSPVVSYRSTSSASHLDEATQTQLTKFSLLTHGFGTLAVVTTLETMINCLRIHLALLESFYGERGDSQFAGFQPPASAVTMMNPQQYQFGRR